MLRYGVIGTGMMGVEHIENLLALPDAVVTAIADPVEGSRGRALALLGDRQPGVRVAEHVDHRSLLDTDACDVVVVASPNHTHVDIALDVIAAGVHALLEKPLCTTVADCRRVIDADAARRSAAGEGPVLWMGLEYRYMPATTRLLAEVAAGVTGAVRMVAVREHRFPFLTKVGDWNRFSVNTGGTLVEKCCHFFDLMNQVADIAVPGARPVRVMASGGADVNHRDERYPGSVAGRPDVHEMVPDILDNAYVIVEYDSGLRGMLDLCMFAEASRHEQEISVVGDAGKVEALLPPGLLRIGRRADGWGVVTETSVHDDRVAHQGLHHGASYLEHVDLAEAIRTGRPAAVTVLDGLWSVAVGEAAHRSIDERRPVELHEVLGDAGGPDWSGDHA